MSEEPKDSRPTPRPYDKRYVAFLDILGFADLIQHTSEDSDYYDAVLRILTRVSDERQRNPRITKGPKVAANIIEAEEVEEAIGPRVYTFSDCIAMSAKATPEGLLELFDHVSQLCVSLIYEGVFVRGGIVLGNLFDDYQVVFGPALVAAYRLESQSAKYPRIVVNSDIYRASKDIEWRVAGRDAMTLDARLRQDFDGLFHLNWLFHQHTIYAAGFRGFPTDRPLDFERIREIIIHWMKEHRNKTDVFAKLCWFANYFNEVIERGRSANILGTHHNLPTINIAEGKS